MLELTAQLDALRAIRLDLDLFHDSVGLRIRILHEIGTALFAFGRFPKLTDVILDTLGAGDVSDPSAEIRIELMAAQIIQMDAVLDCRNFRNDPDRKSVV